MLENLLAPESVAVIGASRESGSVGNIIFQNCLESKCKAFPINPYAEKIADQKAYPSVLDVEEDIDLAVIAVPAKIVPKVLRECGKKGIKLVVIISGGFAERGGKGKERQEKVCEIAEKYDIQILGPNTLGNIVPSENVNYSFFKGSPKKGEIAFISQSGALGASIMDWSIEEGIGFSAFISVGNRVDIGFPQLISLLGKDEDTSVICLYIESLNDGKAFMKACEEVEKPIIILKAGKSEHGQRASQSHTGSMAGKSKIYSTAFDQIGAIEVVDLEELFNTASFLVKNRRPEGDRLCILSNTGGLGVVTADLASHYGLDIPELPKKVKEKLNEVLPPFWNKMNPIDIIGDADYERYRKALKVLERHRFFNALIVISTPQGAISPIKTAKEIVWFQERTQIPLATCFIGGKDAQEAERILERENIPNFFEPEDAVRLLSKSRKK